MATQKARYQAPDGYELGWKRRVGHGVHICVPGSRHALCGQTVDLVGSTSFGNPCSVCHKLLSKRGRPPRSK